MLIELPLMCLIHRVMSKIVGISGLKLSFKAPSFSYAILKTDARNVLSWMDRLDAFQFKRQTFSKKLDIINGKESAWLLFLLPLACFILFCSYIVCDQLEYSGVIPLSQSGILNICDIIYGCYHLSVFGNGHLYIRSLFIIGNM